MEFIGNIARKTGEPSLLAVEATKTQLAREIGEESGLFYVPKVIRFDAKAGVLEFERLEGLVTLHELAIRKDARLFAILEKTGLALAAVHEKLVLPDEMRHELPPEWMGDPQENVFIHGDFALCNLSFHETSGQLVIMDWSAAPLLGRTPTYGSRFFDVLWCISSIFHGAPIKRTLNWNSEEMSDAFLAGYAVGIDPKKLDKLSGYWPRFMRLHKRNIWYLAIHRNFYKSCVFISSQAFLYYKLRLYGRKFL